MFSLLDTDGSDYIRSTEFLRIHKIRVAEDNGDNVRTEPFGEFDSG